MASKPGILPDWPWKPLGSFKYLILAPWAIHSVYSFIVSSEETRDLTYLMILPSLFWRMLHNQIWISLSRHMTAKGRRRIVDKGLEFNQVDREQNWLRYKHRTKFRTNFSLFLPFYDYIYGTMGNSSEQPQENSLQRKEEDPDIVRRLRFPSLALRPRIAKWYAWLMGQITFCSMMLTWVYGRRLSVDILRWVIWALPKLTFSGLFVEAWFVKFSSDLAQDRMRL